MEKLALKQQEKTFRKILFDHFEKQGYIYFHEYQNSNFRLFKENSLEQFTIYGLTNTKNHSFIHEYAFLAIEDIIIEIGLPNYDLSSYQSRQNYFFTFRNNQINLTFNTEEHPVETEQDCLDYCQSIIYYMETKGKDFVEKYSYLPNILKELDEDTKNGINWSYGVLNGITAPFFKGLIISKMCNDPKLHQKIELVDNIYYPLEHKLLDFIPYYEKLKERLKSIEPIYNIQA
jgi:hypothetical protein